MEELKSNDLNNEIINEKRKVEYYYIDLTELIPSYKKSETTIDEMDNLFLKVVDNKIAIHFRALDTHKVLKTIIKDSKYYKKHPSLKEEIENLEGLYGIDLGERIFELCVKKMIIFVNGYKTKVGVNYSEEFNSEIIKVLLRLFDIEQLRRVYSMKLIYDILDINDGFLEDGKESIEKLNAFKNLLESNYSDNYKDFSKYFIEYVISKNPINAKEELLKLKSFQTNYVNRPELAKKLKTEYKIKIKDEDLIVDVYYLDTKTRQINKKVMDLHSAIKLYNYQFSSMGANCEKKVFRIDGEIPEARKYKYPCRKKRKADYFDYLEFKYDVELSNKLFYRIKLLAKNSLGYLLSNKFIESFCGLIGVYNLKRYDDDKITHILKTIITDRNLDTQSEITLRDVRSYVCKAFE